MRYLVAQPPVEENLPALLGLFTPLCGSSADVHIQGVDLFWEVTIREALELIPWVNAALQLLLMGVTTVSPILTTDIVFPLSTTASQLLLFSRHSSFDAAIQINCRRNDCLKWLKFPRWSWWILRHKIFKTRSSDSAVTTCWVHLVALPFNRFFLYRYRKDSRYLNAC